jgi:hypothetical protein
MPKGQAHTTWFPELKEILKKKWDKKMSIQEQFELVDELNLKLNQIRKDGSMQAPMICCPNCKSQHRGAFSNVSITATYFAIEKEEIIDHSEFLALKREWNKYSKTEGVNVYGEKKAEIKNHESTTKPTSHICSFLTNP